MVTKFRELGLDNCLRYPAIGSQPGTFQVRFERQIENYGGAGTTRFSGQIHEAAPILRTQVGGIDQAQLLPQQPLLSNQVEQIEGILGGGLVVLVV